MCLYFPSGSCSVADPKTVTHDIGARCHAKAAARHTTRPGLGVERETGFAQRCRPVSSSYTTVHMTLLHIRLETTAGLPMLRSPDPQSGTRQNVMQRKNASWAVGHMSGAGI